MSFYYYYLFLIILLKLMQRIWLNQVYDSWRGFFPLLYNMSAFNKHHFLVLIFFLSSTWWNVDHIANYIIMLALYEGVIVNQKFLSLCLYIVKMTCKLVVCVCMSLYIIIVIAIFKKTLNFDPSISVVGSFWMKKWYDVHIS